MHHAGVAGQSFHGRRSSSSIQISTTPRAPRECGWRFANPRSAQLRRTNFTRKAMVAIEAPEVLAVPRSAVLWSGASPRLYVEQEPGVLPAAPRHPRPAGRRLLGNPRGGEGRRARRDQRQHADRRTGAALERSRAGRGVAALPDPAMAMDAAEHDALEKFLRSVAELSAVLARDDLAAFNTALDPAAARARESRRIKEERATGPCPDLAGARRAFLPAERSGRRLCAAGARRISRR